MYKAVGSLTAVYNTVLMISLDYSNVKKYSTFRRLGKTSLGSIVLPRDRSLIEL